MKITELFFHFTGKFNKRRVVFIRVYFYIILTFNEIQSLLTEETTKTHVNRSRVFSRLFHYDSKCIFALPHIINIHYKFRVILFRRFRRIIRHCKFYKTEGYDIFRMAINIFIKVFSGIFADLTYPLINIIYFWQIGDE